MESTLVTERPTPRPEAYDDDEVNLYGVLETILRRRIAILVAVVVAGAAVFGVSLLMKPTYEATARIAVNASVVAETPSGSMTALMPYTKTVLESPEVAQAVLDRLQLNKPPYSLSANRFLDENITVALERDASVLVARGRFSDAEMAARIANQLVDDGIARTLTLTQGETVVSPLKSQAEHSQQRMIEASRRRESFLKSTQIEVLRNEVDLMMARHYGVRPLKLSIEGEREEFAVRGQVPTAAAEMKQNLASQRLTAEETLKLNELYSLEVEMARVQAEYDVAHSSYIKVATRYEEARAQESGGQLKVLHRAIPPDRPISPRPLRNTAIAMSVVLLVAAAWAVVVELTRRSRAS